jgi:hypothetical protein
MDIRVLDQRALKITEAIVSRVDVGLLDRPSPCAEWTLGQLLAHMVGQNYGFAAAARGETSGMTPATTSTAGATGGCLTCRRRQVMEPRWVRKPGSAMHCSQHRHGTDQSVQGSGVPDGADQRLCKAGVRGSIPLSSTTCACTNTRHFGQLPAKLSNSLHRSGWISTVPCVVGSGSGGHRPDRRSIINCAVVGR